MAELVVAVVAGIEVASTLNFVGEVVREPRSRDCDIEPSMGWRVLGAEMGCP